MENEFKIICPFCNAPYTAKMVDELEASKGYVSGPATIEGSISIVCSNCNKVVYKKEYEDY